MTSIEVWSPTRNLAGIGRTGAALQRGLRHRWGWLSGMGVNLVLSLLCLVVAPLTAEPHRDWAIMVGSYFAVFLLADVSTTNALGGDARRVQARLRNGTPLRRILLIKNATLLLVIGVPTMIATAVITIMNESSYHLALTLPGVLLPILIWLGIGNLVSVALPVAALPVRQRWQQRRDLVTTGRWLLVVVIPYALCSVVDPMTRLPLIALHALRTFRLGGPAVPAALLIISGLLLYGVLTGAALILARRRSLRFHDLETAG